MKRKGERNANKFTKFTITIPFSTSKIYLNKAQFRFKRTGPFK